MERSLALMCGAGVLPARMACEARRLGWRVIAFTFGAAPLDGVADRVVPSSIVEIAPVLSTLAEEGVSAALFSGKFWLRDVLTVDETTADAAARDLDRRARSRADIHLAEVVVSMLEGLGVTVLDQRPFVGDWLARPGGWSSRAPTAAESQDIAHGLRVARTLAELGVGQTVVVKHGIVAAVEAVDGTTETIRRGTELAGAGAVVVKTVSRDNDYRFDLPAIGPETIDAAVRGGAAVLALAADRLLIVEPEATRKQADAAGLALVAVDAEERERPAA